MNKALIAGATATVVALTAVAPATAAPVLTNTAAVKSAADNPVVDVRWGWGGWLAAGIIGGLAFGALTSPYYSYGYGYGYGYGVPAYPYPYGYAGYYGYSPYSYGYAPYYGWSGYSYAYVPRYYRARRYYRYYR